MATEVNAGDDNILEADFLVIGAGMAGMTAAAYAAHHGANVIVVEKAADIGGSALLSGGGLWTAASYDVLRTVNPLGEADLNRTLIDNYDAAVAWVKSLGTLISERISTVKYQGFDSVGHEFDVAGYMKLCRATVQDAGGWIVTGATVESLLQENGAVCGAVIADRDGVVTVRAQSTLLASGGFQGNAEMRRKYIGEHAADIVVRANPNSKGDGLRLGLSVGAATSRHMDGWYGHTLPWPLNRALTTADFLPLAQFYLSPRALIINRQGQRFTDESRGYYHNAQQVAKLPEGRAIVVFDEALRVEDENLCGVDRIANARALGAHAAVAQNLDELNDAVAAWGYADIRNAIEAFNEKVLTRPEQLQPSRIRHHRPVTQHPFYVIEVQPAITFTHGGLRIDTNAHVLNDRDAVIPGLYAAGVDAGGMYHQAYAGGLAMSCVMGMQAAKSALQSKK
jgi:succinate dehydrogenase/fumarate reductase flavoprotein subunit